MEIDELIEQVKKNCRHQLAVDPERSDRQLKELEAKIGFSFPEDLKKFYRAFDTANFDKSTDSLNRFHLLSELCSVSFFVTHDDTDDAAPSHWQVFLETHDGDGVAIDLNSGEPGVWNILDVDHGNFEEPRVIGKSFSEFLRLALTCEESLDVLDEEIFKEYGRLKYTRKRLSLTHEKIASSPAWCKKFGDEVGPERCKKAGCTHLKIRLSVFCRLHHYESTCLPRRRK